MMTRTTLNAWETVALEQAMKLAIEAGHIEARSGAALLDKIQDAQRITITRGFRAKAW